MKIKLLAAVLVWFCVFENNVFAQPPLCPNETIIGTTNWQIQSNFGSNGRKIFEWNDHTMAAVWTLGYNSSNWNDRGTGYNYFDGINWGPVPGTRIESVKTGYPNIYGSVNNGEYIFNHTSTNVYSALRLNKGSGPWVQSASPMDSLDWIRFAIGGSNNQTIHLIGHKYPYSINIKSPLRYWRSQDLGMSWDIQDAILPVADSNSLVAEFPDQYEISARGDLVAFVAGGFSNDLILCKSLDNGNTWAKTIVNQFPLPLYDQNGITDTNSDGIADTLMTTDGSMSLVIDNNSMVHVWAGKTKIIDPDSVLGFFYFPDQDDVLYWNESFAPNTILNHQIAQLEDINNDGFINVLLIDGYNIYPCGTTSMVTSGVDNMNNLYVAYSALVEDTSNNIPTTDTSCRNIYMTYSHDNGLTWATPSRICPNYYEEQVFPSMAENVLGNPKLIYCEDSLAGNFFQNSLMYVVCTTVNMNTVVEQFAGQAEFTISPNPATDKITISFPATTTENITIKIFSITGEVIYEKLFQNSKTLEKLNATKIIDVKDFSCGIYFLSVQTGNEVVTRKMVLNH